MNDWHWRSRSGVVKINVAMSELPDFIADLHLQGLRSQDLDPLMNSAEGYIQVWERAEARGATVP